LRHPLMSAFADASVPELPRLSAAPPSGAELKLSEQCGSHKVQQFLKQWGVTWRVSSAHYAQSNGRAEAAVKTAKRLLADNISRSGQLDNDKFARAILQHRNTPLPGIGLSPAQLLYGRTLRDHMPSLTDALRVRKEWVTLAEDRERSLANRHMVSMEHYNTNTHELPPLRLGDHTSVQNQTGNHPTRWDKTGRVVEVRDRQQYVIRMDGSGRCSLRNRRFLRKISAFNADPAWPTITPTKEQPQPTTHHAKQISAAPAMPPSDHAQEAAATISPAAVIAPATPAAPATPPPAASPRPPDLDQPAPRVTEPTRQPSPRRSTRTRRPPACCYQPSEDNPMTSAAARVPGLAAL